MDLSTFIISVFCLLVDETASKRPPHSPAWSRSKAFRRGGPHHADRRRVPQRGHRQGHPPLLSPPLRRGTLRGPPHFLLAPGGKPMEDEGAALAGVPRAYSPRPSLRTRGFDAASGMPLRPRLPLPPLPRGSRGSYKDTLHRQTFHSFRIHAMQGGSAGQASSPASRWSQPTPTSFRSSPNSSSPPAGSPPLETATITRPRPTNSWRGTRASNSLRPTEARRSEILLPKGARC